MAVRDSWAVQAAGGVGIIDVEEARVAIGGLVMPGSSAVNAKSGFRPSTGASSPGVVTATGTPDGFVHVAPFQLFLQTVRGAVGGPYLMTLDAQFDVNILSTPADPTNPRNDLVIAQQSDVFYGDGTSPMVIRQVVGTPSGAPVDPAVSGSGDYVTLARVRVDALATTIVAAKITDLRTAGHAKSLVGGLSSVALGGIDPLTSQAERDALPGKYGGLAVWRTDTSPTGRLEIWDAIAGVWQQFNPDGAPWVDFTASATITATSGGFVKGASTYISRYQQVGKTIDFEMYWLIGTGSGFAGGTGVLNFLLPVSAHAQAVTMQTPGSGWGNVSGVSLIQCTAYISDATHAQLLVQSPTTGLTSALAGAGQHPGFVTGDHYRFNIRYEAA